MRLLIVFALFGLFWWLLRRMAAAHRQRRKPSEKEPESMVTCAYCGVNQPVSESLRVGERYYCCPEHRHAAAPTDD